MADGHFMRVLRASVDFEGTIAITRLQGAIPIVDLQRAFAAGLHWSRRDFLVCVAAGRRGHCLVFSKVFVVYS